MITNTKKEKINEIEFLKICDEEFGTFLKNKYNIKVEISYHNDINFIVFYLKPNNHGLITSVVIQRIERIIAKYPLKLDAWEILEKKVRLQYSTN